MGLGLGPQVRGVDGGEHDDRQLGILLVEPTDRSECVRVGQNEVDDHEIRLVGRRDEVGARADGRDDVNRPSSRNIALSSNMLASLSSPSITRISARATSSGATMRHRVEHCELPITRDFGPESSG